MNKEIEICGTCLSNNPNSFWECDCSYWLNDIKVNEDIFNAIILLKKYGFTVTLPTKK